jgi:hypothetical protein
VSIAATVLGAVPARAHTVVELYNPYYLVGAALAVALSFVMVAFVVRHPPHVRVGRTIGHLEVDMRGGASRAIGIAMLAVVVVTGIAGSQIARWNPAPVLVAFLLGGVLPLVQLLTGDVWGRISPWPAVPAVFAPRPVPTGGPRFAAATGGSWPAAALLAILLVLTTSAIPWSPRALGVAVLSYAALTWAAMVLLGAAWWLRHGEVVTAVSRLFAALSVRHRPFGADLFHANAGAGTVALVVVLVAGGFLQPLVETRLWETTWQSLGVTAADLGRVHVAAALGAVTALVGSSYAGACLAVRAIIPGWSFGDILRAFALALVPVGALFHLAAGVEHVAVDAQQVLRLASDPFGTGANLLGTRSWPLLQPDPVIVWHVQVVLVVLAHVIAVYVAHVRALVVLGRPRLATRSQVPMLGLMLLYTVTGLWLLSTVPIVVGDDPGAPAR